MVFRRLRAKVAWTEYCLPRHDSKSNDDQYGNKGD